MKHQIICRPLPTSRVSKFHFLKCPTSCGGQILLDDLPSKDIGNFLLDFFSCRGCSWTSAFSRGRGTRGREPQDVPKSHEYRNVPLREQLSLYFPPSFSFCREKKNSMGTWEHIKLGELPQHNALQFFCQGRSLKIHTETRGVILWPFHLH